MICQFSVSDLQPLIAHARNSKQFSGTWGNPDPGYPGLLFVKDFGAYLMSNGIPRLVSEEKPDSSKVVYAKDMRPEDGFIEGDDFVELIPLDKLIELEHSRQLDIIVTEDILRLCFYK